MARTQAQPAPVLSPARQSLAGALEAKKRAISLVEKAQQVVEAAAAAVEKAREEASKYAEVDGDAVKARLAALKGDPDAKSPEEIRAARTARLVAQEELESANQTLTVAKQELTEAQGEVKRSEMVAASYAVSALSEVASDAIAAWNRINVEREVLRMLLRALVMEPNVSLDILKPEQRERLFNTAASQLGLPLAPLEWERIQNKCGAALAWRYENDPGPAIARAGEYWKRFTDAILADANAQPGALPSSQEIFG
jgi:hypothetical protein